MKSIKNSDIKIPCFRKKKNCQLNCFGYENNRVTEIFREYLCCEYMSCGYLIFYLLSQKEEFLVAFHFFYDWNSLANLDT